KVYSSCSVVSTHQNGLDARGEASSRRSVMSTPTKSDIRASYPIDTAIPELTSSFTREQYLAAIDRPIDYIPPAALFHLNLAQRSLHPAIDDSVALYLRLRERNPATFGGYFDVGDFQIVSASPERFLQVIGDQVEARPIKGTRRRLARPEADLFAGDELRES